MKKITLFSLIICALALNVCAVQAQSKTTSSNNEVVTDIDGNVYSTVTIGTQIWLVENLKTTKYRNGDVIGTTSSANLEINGEEAPKYQWSWRNVETNVPLLSRYYTWYAATDPRNIAPVGYRVATDQDLIDLATYLIENGDLYSFDGLKNTGTVAGGNKIVKALVSTTTSWTTVSTVGTPGNDKAANNASGFSLFPSGQRLSSTSNTDKSKLWEFINSGAYLWTSTEHPTNSSLGIFRRTFNSSTEFITRPAGENKKNGMSVRCIKGEVVPAGIKNVESNPLNLQLYPSQVKDLLTISFVNALTEKVKLDILSTDGKIVYRNEYLSKGGLDKISVQLSHLKQGLYLCRVNSANATSVVKFTKN